MEQSINSMILKAKSKKRVCFNLNREQWYLNKLMQKLPKSDETFRMLSVKGGFSSIAFVECVSKIEPIEELTISSLAIGKRHIDLLDKMKKQKQIDKVNFIICSIFKKTSMQRYGYFEHFKNIIEKNNWQYSEVNNHSKIILMKTSKNYYVLETSSNFNENPKIEQFVFENDKNLYEFYYNFFIALFDVEKEK